MRVNIVCRSDSASVLRRMAKVLADGTGWPIVGDPSRKADLNYFFPYLEWRHQFDATPTAALFSHYDEPLRRKAERWVQVASAVDLRLAWARRYLPMLKPFGDSALVTPPLDRDKFRPGPRPTNHRPRVGVSGIVHQGGRKGERLVARLAEDAAELGIDVVASGGGWPVQTKWYEWGHMQDYYRSLDVFLCSSIIEGVPYPPLEAMACGTPVVVPKGVGLLDDVPDARGVHRYRAEDYGSMRGAVESALGGVADRHALRDATSGFTTEAWCADHEDAFRRLLHGEPKAEGPLPPWEGNSGVFYVAYGGPARECAIRAMRSWRKHMLDVPICLASDEPIGIEDVFVQEPDADIGARSVKTRLWDLTPPEWNYVLYLDADTEVVADVSFLFQLLADGWEMLLCTNPSQYAVIRGMVRPDNKDEADETFKALGTEEALQLNGGVFGFRRNERTERFCRRWHEEWQRWGKRDQGALHRALYAEPLRVYVLGSEWNTVTRYTPAERTAGILHYPLAARRWRGIIHGRSDSSEAWAAVHPESGVHA